MPRPMRSFNPLAIGSNVLICLAQGKELWVQYTGFNPLAIGSNVLMHSISVETARSLSVSIP